MKCPHEIGQMKAVAAGLTSLWRAAFNNESAIAACNEDIDCLSARSAGMAKTASAAGDSPRAAVFDFIGQTIGRMRQGGGRMAINSGKLWRIAYTRFRETASTNGNWVFSRPIVTSIPWRRCACENRLREEGEDPAKDIESWRCKKGFDTKEEAEAALASFPMEEYELLACWPPLHIWAYADGREVWEKDRSPGKDAPELDPMYRQVERENEHGAFRAPPSALMGL